MAGVAEMLLQSHTGVVDVLPSLPSTWADGSVSGLRARGDVTVDAIWSGGSADRIELTAGQDRPLTVRRPLFAGRFDVRDATTGRRFEFSRDGSQLNFDATAGHTYVVTTEVSVDVSAPSDVGWGETFPVEVTVRAAGGRPVPSTGLSLELPDGWQAEPATHRVRPLRAGSSQTFEFQVTAGQGPEQAAVSAVAAGDGWSARAGPRSQRMIRR